MTDQRFDKFTDRARKVLILAQDEAQRQHHNYIGTEHLLLALVREGEGIAARVLEDMGVDLNKIRSAVEFIIGRGDRPVVGEVGLTPRSRRVIELAIDEARRLGHNYIGTEHLLLGLVRDGEGIAAGVLESLGVNLQRVRETTIKVISNPPKPKHLPTEPEKPPKLHQIIPLSIQEQAELWLKLHEKPDSPFTDGTPLVDGSNVGEWVRLGKALRESRKA